MLNPKRARVEKVDAQLAGIGEEGDEEQVGDEEEDDVDSMLGSDSEDNEADAEAQDSKTRDPNDRPPSEAPSTATTDLSLTPESLALRFPTLFNPPADQDPKVLITTSLNSTLHYEADLLTNIFPGSAYIRRTAHFHSYKYSIREIAAYASARDYTTVVVLNEERKRPKGLDIVHLPHGPMFHFSISNWIEGKKLPGHGRPTNHYPELTSMVSERVSAC